MTKRWNNLTNTAIYNFLHAWLQQRAALVFAVDGFTRAYFVVFSRGRVINQKHLSPEVHISRYIRMLRRTTSVRLHS